MVANLKEILTEKHKWTSTTQNCHVTENTNEHQINKGDREKGKRNRKKK